jgi:D-amino-acid dehydrogenase
LVRAAKAAHEALIAEAGAEDCIGGHGLSEVFRDAGDLAKRIKEAVAVRDASGVGFTHWQRTPPPELAGITGAHAGGITWTDSLACTDPHGLAMRFLDHVEKRQGRLVSGDARGLARTETGWSVPTEAGLVEADAAVVCLGVAANDLAGVTGVRIPFVPKRGYHLHYAPNAERPIAHPVLDADHGYVLAPMRAGLRLTTGAQLLGRAAAPQPRQIALAERAAREMFAMGAAEEAAPWTGTRPCAADMLPVIGEAPGRPGLWLATAHGHQGLTLSAITGALLADAMAGRPTSVDIAPFSPGRFAA